MKFSNNESLTLSFIDLNAIHSCCTKNGNFNFRKKSKIEIFKRISSVALKLSSL